jgi:hypothetical protein
MRVQVQRWPAESRVALHGDPVPASAHDQEGPDRMQE